MADIAKYQIISAGGVELNGTITIEDAGFGIRAVVSFQDTTPNGILIDINYTSEENISLSPIKLADIAMIEVNSQLGGDGIIGNLTYKLIEPEVEPEVIPNNGEEEIPVYIVKSSVPGGLKGQIYFEFRELNGQRELGGIGELNQDSYNTEEVIFSSVGESSTDFNYRGMGDSILQQLNNQIKEINGVGEFGVLSIVETQTEPPQNFYDYTIVGKVVDGGTKTPLGNVHVCFS